MIRDLNNKTGTTSKRLSGCVNGFELFFSEGFFGCEIHGVDFLGKEIGLICHRYGKLSYGKN